MAHIYYEGHSNCRISDGLNIWIDPFFTGNSLAKHDWRTLEKPDVVVITHGHSDHIGDAIEIVKESKAMLACVVELAQYCQEQGVPSEQILNHGMGWNMGGSVEYKKARFTIYQAFHSSPYGPPTSFVIESPSGLCYYHAGDTALFSDMKLIGAAHDIDLAFLPIGNVFTMNPRQAALAAQFLNAKHVMPMHYKTFPMLEQSADNFVQALKNTAPHIQALVLDANADCSFEK